MISNLPLLALRLLSSHCGAGHDAQCLAEILPAAVHFAPSIGGLSRHWTENTDDDDFVVGARTKATAAAQSP